MRPWIVTSECQMFLTSMFSYLLFSNPTHKTKIGLQIGGKLLISKHLHQPLQLANQKQEAAVRSYLLHSSVAGVRLCCNFYQSQQTVQKC